MTRTVPSASTKNAFILGNTFELQRFHFRGHWNAVHNWQRRSRWAGRSHIDLAAGNPHLSRDIAARFER